MRFVDDIEAWDRAVSRGARAVSYVDVIAPNGDEQTIEAVVSGPVTLDITAEHRGRCDLQLAGLDLVPKEVTDLFAPYSNRFRVRRGIRHWDGVEQTIALGVFGIEDSNTEVSPGNVSVGVQGLDSSKRIHDASFEAPHEIPLGTLVTTEIQNIILSIKPDQVFDFIGSAVTTPQLVAQEQSSPWTLVQGLAKSIGCDLYYDGDDVLVLRPTAILGTSEAAAVFEDGAEGTLANLGISWSRSDAFNRVIVTSGNTSQSFGLGAVIPRGVATDENPLSPTQYGGPFGRVPRFYSNEYVTTQVQADDTAAGILAKELGTLKALSFNTVVNPRCEPGDIVRVASEYVGMADDAILDQITIPTAVEESASGQTRAMRVI